ncbi:MAG: hypothetical protein H0U77_12105 [Nocardioidaceae bacterium]|nr:hypothetical protein [Nocardioidaceae bacterium]
MLGDLEGDVEALAQELGDPSSIWVPIAIVAQAPRRTSSIGPCQTGLFPASVTYAQT